MAANTIDSFSNSIDEDIVWRKKEISNLMLIHDDEYSELIVKSLVLLVYSHWEGCVKNLCKEYLRYVSKQKISISDLTDNYQAIALKGRIQQMMDSQDSLTMSNELTVIEIMKGYTDKKFKIKLSDNDKTVINTQSNLNYDIFQSLLNIIGLREKSCLATKKQYLDEKLLKNRNKIAHGNKFISGYDEFDLDIESLKSIKDLIFVVIDSLASDLKYYVENELYLSENSDEITEYNLESNENLESSITNIDL